MAIIHWFPTVIYRIIRILEIPNCIIFRTVANTFHWLGPILNPIMYSFMSAKFRRQLVWTLRCTNITKDRFFTEAMNSLSTMIYGPYNMRHFSIIQNRLQFQMSMLRSSRSQRTESTRQQSSSGSANKTFPCQPNYNFKFLRLVIGTKTAA